MKRVLIVDDALELGRLLQTVFLTLDASLNIQVVPSAEEALLESSRKPLDLLVSDIRLPGMSGFDLVKKIRARHPSLKVMVITGLTDPNLVDRAREMQVDGFFRKPLDMSAFIETAARCLELQRAEAAPLAARQSPSAGSGGPAGAAALVAKLRQRLGALAVIIFDEQGRVVAQAGEAPGLPPIEQWAAPALALLNAGKKLSALVGNAQNQQVMAFPGPQVQAALAPLANGALLILLPPGPSSLRLALAVEEALEAQGALVSAVAEKASPAAEPPAAVPPPAVPEKHVELPPTAPLELSPKPPVPPSPPAPEVSLDEFEKLLRQSEKELKNKDIDQFWDKVAAAGGSGSAANTDSISYEQARKMGLAPEEDSSK
jgi:DNA-binding response OmpR family regulator